MMMTTQPAAAPPASPATTLADLAVTHPAASRVFHRHRLDFCCHGRRPLAEACAERGLDAAAVIAEIAREGPGAALEARWDERPMRACIAGGALMDPLCDLDFRLDIGGRIIEVVEKILREEEIPVVASETGGFFTCRLSLNLQTWESRIEPTSNEPAFFDKMEFKGLGDEVLAKAIEGIRPIPQVALKIIRMINEPGHDMREIAEKVRTDQVLSARVHRLCNAAFIGLRKKVDSINQALIMLGEKQILRLAVSISLERLFSDCTRGYSLCKGGLYYHALGTAVIAEMLANITANTSTGIAYTQACCMT